MSTLRLRTPTTLTTLTAFALAASAAIAITLPARTASAQPVDEMDLTGAVFPPVVNAYVLAGVSDAAYLDDGFARRSDLAALGLHEADFTSIGTQEDAQVVFAETDDLLIVAVRGTQEREDIWTDAQVRQVEPSWRNGIQIHNGFLDSADDLYARVRTEVRAAEDDGKAIFFTGHSLGGAITQILALRITLAGHDITGVITFGTPDVGNEDWAELYYARLGSVTSLITHDRDPMPCRPRLWWYDPAAKFLELKTGQLEPVLEPNCEVGGLDEYHGIAKYIAKLRTLQAFNVIDRPAVSFQISTAAATRGQLGQEVYREAWTDGWSAVVPYRVGSDFFVALYKRSSGRLDLRRMNAEGTLGSLVETRASFEASALIQAAAMNGSSYLFVTDLFGKVSRYSFRSDGKLCSAGTGSGAGCQAIASFDVGVPVVAGFKLNPYTQADVGVVGNRTYLVFLSRLSGAVAIREISANQLGRVAMTDDWTSGWSSSRFFRVGAKTFLFLLKEATGQVHIHPVNADGTLGPRAHAYDWTAGWTEVLPYEVGGQDYLALIKGGAGDVHIHELNDNGSVGTMVESRSWSVGWQTTAIVPTGTASRALFIIKR